MTETPEPTKQADPPALAAAVIRYDPRIVSYTDKQPGCRWCRLFGGACWRHPAVYCACGKQVRRV